MLKKYMLRIATELICMKSCRVSYVSYSSKPSSKYVYGCGLVASGSLMSGIAVKYAFNSAAMELRKPTCINYCNAKHIRHIASGFGFSLFASKSKLYGGGIDIFSNDLQQSSDYWSRGRRVMLSDGGDKSSDALDGETIIGLAAGRRHFLVATQQKVYAFGDNAHGQCGHDPAKKPFIIPQQKSISSIQLPSCAHIQQVHCTLDTSFVLLDSGELFSFGLGTDGQLGRGIHAFDWKCMPVEGDLKNVKISALRGSTDTLMAISECGELFMWGQNEYAQMYPFSMEMQEGFSRHIRLAIPPLLSADSTATSCLALTVDGQVFVWGYGVLGQGPNINVLKRPSQLDANLFSAGPNDSGQVKQVFAGNTSMFAISKQEHLFAWGVNRFAHLGLGHTNNQYFPYQIVLPKRPINISIAPDHTLFLLQ